MRSLAAVLCTLVLPLLFFVSASPAAAAGGPRLDPGERALIRAINRQRSAHGLRAVRPHGGLTRAADAHSRDMLATNVFSHGAMAQRVRSYARLRRVGENLAWSHGFRARTVVGMWMNSAPHRAVMLRRSYRYIGVGRRSGHSICMVTADFGSRH